MRNRHSGKKPRNLFKAFQHLSVRCQSYFFEAGKAAGERFVEDTPKVMNADESLLLETVVQRFMDAGLGKIENLKFNPKEGEVKLRILNNFFVELNGEESACCNYVEGFVSCIYGQIIGETPNIQKTKCVENGISFCEWQMTRK